MKQDPVANDTEEIFHVQAAKDQSFFLELMNPSIGFQDSPAGILARCSYTLASLPPGLINDVIDIRNVVLNLDACTRCRRFY